MCRDPDDTERCGDCGENEHEGHERRDQGAEDKQQHDDRDRDRDHEAPLQVVGDHRLQIAIDCRLPCQIGRDARNWSDCRPHLGNLELCCSGLERGSNPHIGQGPTGLQRGCACRTEYLRSPRGRGLGGFDLCRSRSLPVLRGRDQHERRVAALSKVILKQFQHLGGLRARDVEAVREEIVKTDTRIRADGHDHEPASYYRPAEAIRKCGEPKHQGITEPFVRGITDSLSDTWVRISLHVRPAYPAS